MHAGKGTPHVLGDCNVSGDWPTTSLSGLAQPTLECSTVGLHKDEGLYCIAHKDEGLYCLAHNVERDCVDVPSHFGLDV